MKFIPLESINQTTTLYTCILSHNLNTTSYPIPNTNLNYPHINIIKESEIIPLGRIRSEDFEYVIVLIASSTIEE